MYLEILPICSIAEANYRLKIIHNHSRQVDFCANCCFWDCEFCWFGRFLSGDRQHLDSGLRQSLQAAESGSIILGILSCPWNERLASLIGYPSLQLESLVMAQQFKAAREVLQRIPELHDDDMVLHYARFWSEHSCIPQRLAALTCWVLEVYLQLLVTKQKQRQAMWREDLIKSDSISPYDISHISVAQSRCLSSILLCAPLLSIQNEFT